MPALNKLRDAFMSATTISPKYRGPWTLLKKEMLRFWRVGFQTVAAPVITALLYLFDFFSRARRPRASIPRRALHGFFDTGSDHDVGFAKCLRQQLIEFDSVQSDG